MQEALAQEEASSQEFSVQDSAMQAPSIEGSAAQEACGDDFLYVTDRHGVRHKIEAVEGWRIMEIIRAHGLDLSGLCDGACECATCHVHIAPHWISRLREAREDEEMMLDSLPIISQHSRLSCQILYSRSLAGLELTLADTL